MAMPSFYVLSRRCFIFRAFINQSLKLNALQPTTCTRKYAMTYDEEEREKKIKKQLIKVNVIMPDQKVSCMTLEQAHRMAKRRSLTLTKILDPPKFASFSGRDVYELLTKSQHIKHSAESSEVPTETEVKDQKTVTFSATIALNDMNVKLKQIKKWLSKRHSVIIIVADDGTEDGMKEKLTLIRSECQEMGNITIITKKKQTVLTVVPHSDNPESTQKLKTAEDTA